MAVLRVILIFSIIPAILSQCTMEKAQPLFKRSLYEFSVNLLSRIADENENHFVTSTFSIWTLLTCALLGAEGRTLYEMERVLRLQENECIKNKYLEIARTVNNNDTHVTVSRHAIVLHDLKISLLEDYKRKLERTKLAMIVPYTFEDPADVAARINYILSFIFKSIYKEIVSPADLDGVQVMMIDAVFFKGKWNQNFEVKKTKASNFYNEAGESIGAVNLMYINSEFRYSLMHQIKAQVLELPYGVSDRYSMIIFLPLPGVSLHTVISNLKLINLAKINDSMGLDTESVEVQLPRFEISSDLKNLKELMIDLGMKTAFDDTADFSNLSADPFTLSKVIQKAHIEVTEEGTVASAVTQVSFMFKMVPTMFKANKPFLFMIVDKHLEVPLFTGAYSKPTLY